MPKTHKVVCALEVFRANATHWKVNATARRPLPDNDWECIGLAQATGESPEEAAKTAVVLALRGPFRFLEFPEEET